MVNKLAVSMFSALAGTPWTGQVASAHVVGKNEADVAGNKGLPASDKEGYIISSNLKNTNTKRLLFKTLVS